LLIKKNPHTFNFDCKSSTQIMMSCHEWLDIRKEFCDNLPAHP